MQEILETNEPDGKRSNSFFQPGAGGHKGELYLGIIIIHPTTISKHSLAKS